MSDHDYPKLTKNKLKFEPKNVQSLTAEDFQSHPIWQYENNDRSGESLVRPIVKIPVKNLTGKIIGIQIRLADGTFAWVLAGNIIVDNARLTSHFLTISVEHKGRWFNLARYHDHDILERGPMALAAFLGKKVDEVFPFLLDIRPFVQGSSPTLVLEICREPHERLTRAEVIALAVP